MLVLCLMVIFWLEIGQSQQSLLENQIKSTRDNCWFRPISSRKMTIRHKTKGGYLIFYINFIFFSTSKSSFLTMWPPLTSMASKTAHANTLKIAARKIVQIWLDCYWENYIFFLWCLIVVLRRLRVASLTPRNLTGSSLVQVYLFLH